MWSYLWKFIKGIALYVKTLFVSIVAGFMVFAGGKYSSILTSFELKKYKKGLFYALLPVLAVVMIVVIVCIIAIAATQQFDAYFVRLMEVCTPVGIFFLVAGVVLYFLNDKEDRKDLSGEFGLYALLVNSGTLFVGGIAAKLIYVNRESLQFALVTVIVVAMMIGFLALSFTGDSSAAAADADENRAYREQKDRERNNAKLDREIEKAQKRMRANAKHTNTGDNSLAAELSRDEYKRRVKEDQILIEKLSKQRK